MGVTKTRAKATKEVKDINLGLDEVAYNYALRLDTSLFQDIAVLNNIVTETIGENVIDDYQDLLNDPVQYLSNKYWNIYGDKFPSNSNKVQTYIRISGLTHQRLTGLTDSIKDTISKLRNNAPIIEGGTITSGLSEDNFRVVVHKDKTELYKLILKVLSNHKAIKDIHQIPMEFQLLRQYSPMISTRGGILKPSKTFFSKS